MANKFTASLKKMEANTDIENQGSSQGDIQQISGEPIQDIQIAEESLNLNTVPETKKINNTVILDVGGVINNLGTKGRKGRPITLYLNNEVMDRLEVISQEKNISYSKIISAILENALLNTEN